MLWKHHDRPWYQKVIALLVGIRIIYGFARFFLRMAEKQVYYQGTRDNQQKKSRR